MWPREDFRRAESRSPTSVKGVSMYSYVRCAEDYCWVHTYHVLKRLLQEGDTCGSIVLGLNRVLQRHPQRLVLSHELASGVREFAIGVLELATDVLNVVNARAQRRRVNPQLTNINESNLHSALHPVSEEDSQLSKPETRFSEWTVMDNTAVSARGGIGRPGACAPAQVHTSRRDSLPSVPVKRKPIRQPTHPAADQADRAGACQPKKWTEPAE